MNPFRPTIVRPEADGPPPVTAHLEITSGIIRVYSSGGYEAATPFDFVLHLVGDDGVAILKGMKTDDGFERQHMRAINACLKAHRFRRAEWDRAELVDGKLVLRRRRFTIR